MGIHKSRAQVFEFDMELVHQYIHVMFLKCMPIPHKPSMIYGDLYKYIG